VLHPCLDVVLIEVGGVELPTLIHEEAAQFLPQSSFSLFPYVLDGLGRAMLCGDQSNPHAPAKIIYEQQEQLLPPGVVSVIGPQRSQ
jgi:hypothetical protein